MPVHVLHVLHGQNVLRPPHEIPECRRDSRQRPAFRPRLCVKPFPRISTQRRRDAEERREEERNCWIPWFRVFATDCRRAMIGAFLPPRLRNSQKRQQPCAGGAAFAVGSFGVLEDLRQYSSFLGQTSTGLPSSLQVQHAIPARFGTSKCDHTRRITFTSYPKMEKRETRLDKIRGGYNAPRRLSGIAPLRGEMPTAGKCQP